MEVVNSVESYSFPTTQEISPRMASCVSGEHLVVLARRNTPAGPLSKKLDELHTQAIEATFASLGQNHGFRLQAREATNRGKLNAFLQQMEANLEKPVVAERSKKFQRDLGQLSTLPQLQQLARSLGDVRQAFVDNTLPRDIMNMVVQHPLYTDVEALVGNVVMQDNDLKDSQLTIAEALVGEVAVKTVEDILQAHSQIQDQAPPPSMRALAHPLPPRMPAPVGSSAVGGEKSYIAIPEPAPSFPAHLLPGAGRQEDPLIFPDTEGQDLGDEQGLLSVVRGKWGKVRSWAQGGHDKHPMISDVLANVGSDASLAVAAADAALPTSKLSLTGQANASSDRVHKVSRLRSGLGSVWTWGGNALGVVNRHIYKNRVEQGEALGDRDLHYRYEDSSADILERTRQIVEDRLNESLYAVSGGWEIHDPTNLYTVVQAIGENNPDLQLQEDRQEVLTYLLAMHERILPRLVGLRTLADLPEGEIRNAFQDLAADLALYFEPAVDISAQPAELKNAVAKANIAVRELHHLAPNDHNAKPFTLQRLYGVLRSQILKDTSLVRMTQSDGHPIWVLENTEPRVNDGQYDSLVDIWDSIPEDVHSESPIGNSSEYVVQARVQVGPNKDKIAPLKYIPDLTVANREASFIAVVQGNDQASQYVQTAMYRASQSLKLPPESPREIGRIEQAGRLLAATVKDRRHMLVQAQYIQREVGKAMDPGVTAAQVVRKDGRNFVVFTKQGPGEVVWCRPDGKIQYLNASFDKKQSDTQEVGDGVLLIVSGVSPSILAGAVEVAKDKRGYPQDIVNLIKQAHYDITQDVTASVVGLQLPPLNPKAYRAYTPTRNIRPRAIVDRANYTASFGSQDIPFPPNISHGLATGRLESRSKLGDNSSSYVPIAWELPDMQPLEANKPISEQVFDAIEAYIEAGSGELEQAGITVYQLLRQMSQDDSGLSQQIFQEEKVQNALDDYNRIRQEPDSFDASIAAYRKYLYEIALVIEQERAAANGEMSQGNLPAPILPPNSDVASLSASSPTGSLSSTDRPESVGVTGASGDAASSEVTHRLDTSENVNAEALRVEGGEMTKIISERKLIEQIFADEDIEGVIAEYERALQSSDTDHGELEDIVDDLVNVLTHNEYVQRLGAVDSNIGLHLAAGIRVGDPDYYKQVAYLVQLLKEKRAELSQPAEEGDREESTEREIPESTKALKERIFNEGFGIIASTGLIYPGVYIDALGRPFENGQYNQGTIERDYKSFAAAKLYIEGSAQKQGEGLDTRPEAIIKRVDPDYYRKQLQQVWLKMSYTPPGSDEPSKDLVQYYYYMPLHKANPRGGDRIVMTIVVPNGLGDMIDAAVNADPYVPNDVFNLLYPGIAEAERREPERLKREEQRDEYTMNEVQRQMNTTGRYAATTLKVITAIDPTHFTAEVTYPQRLPYLPTS